MKRLLVALLMTASPAAFAAELAVHPQTVLDPKPVFATVESVDTTAARARIGGTIVTLSVDEGDTVTRGQVIATVGDDKLALQLNALDAQIAALTAQQAKAQEDYRRAQELFRNGTVARARLDEAKAAADVADNQLKARQADRSVINQQMTEGQVLAPAPGRVLQVPVTKGAVIMPGETVAMIAADSYILRLQLPERHAQFLKVGDPIQLTDSATPVSGQIRQVYPEIQNGRVMADADAPNLSGYFVGQRVRVLISTDQRSTFVIPSSYITTRSGIDYVSLKKPDGALDVPVQRGQLHPLPNMADGIEILSGLQDGDILLTRGE